MEQDKKKQAAERFNEVLVMYDDDEVLKVAQKYLEELDPK